MERTGRLAGAHDMLIAAHARSAGLIVVTNDLRDFERIPYLRVENWAGGESAAAMIDLHWFPITRAASAVITRDNPKNSMLTPTRRPIAQSAELGQPSQIR
jgi:hypothetical protein